MIMGTLNSAADLDQSGLSLLAAISVRQTLVPHDSNEGVDGQQASESEAVVPPRVEEHRIAS